MSILRTDPFSGSVLIAQTPQTFLYDADGNLVSDGLWTNVWNAENRLAYVESLSTVPAAARVHEDWSYLPDGRWNQRIVSTWNTNTLNYQPSTTNRYVWDGQVLLAVLDQTNGLVMSFMRGLDLSGTMQGAGGVGGLLAINFKTNGTHFVAYDGNGNVAGLVNAADGNASANYEYDPFGQTLRITGTVGKLNPIRFSTQYADDYVGDIKYLYRDYTPSTGRWLNRDPIEEDGGVNLYGFVGNKAIDLSDILGQEWIIDRKGKSRAVAKATSDSDTWDDLAIVAGLDRKDYRQWVQPKPGINDGPSTCTNYTVPNTVFIDTGLEGKLDKLSPIMYQFAREASINMVVYSSLGYKVIPNTSVTDSQIEEHLTSRDIQEYFFFGHGDAGGSGAINTGGPRIYWVEPSRWTLYGIHAMHLYACLSLATPPRDGGIANYQITPWERNVATRGYLSGFTFSINGFHWMLHADNNMVSLPGTNN